MNQIDHVLNNVAMAIKIPESNNFFMVLRWVDKLAKRLKDSNTIKFANNIWLFKNTCGINTINKPKHKVAKLLSLVKLFFWTIKLRVNKDEKRIKKLKLNTPKETSVWAENLYLNNIKTNPKTNNTNTEMEFIGLDLLKMLVIITCFCIFVL